MRIPSSSCSPLQGTDAYCTVWNYSHGIDDPGPNDVSLSPPHEPSCPERFPFSMDPVYILSADLTVQEILKLPKEVADAVGYGGADTWRGDVD